MGLSVQPPTWLRIIFTATVAFISGTATAITIAKPLVFEQVFSPAGQPATLHYRAVFKSRGTYHRLEVWRDGDLRVKRVTDQRLITYAVQRPGNNNFELQMLDIKKRISTHIDRTTLYRLGNITDWFDLTHGLRYPKGPYRLVRSAMPSGEITPVAKCNWYTLTQNGVATRLCWSRAEHLPLIILAADGSPAWRVTAVDHDSSPIGTFVVADRGFVRVDAVKDADRD